MEKSLYIMTCCYSSTGVPEELLIVKVGFYMEKSLYIMHHSGRITFQSLAINYEKLKGKYNTLYVYFYCKSSSCHDLNKKF